MLFYDSHLGYLIRVLISETDIRVQSADRPPDQLVYEGYNKAH